MRRPCIYALGVARGGAVDPGLGLAVLCGVAIAGNILKRALFSLSIETLWLESVERAICCHPLIPHCLYPLGEGASSKLFATGVGGDF